MKKIGVVGILFVVLMNSCSKSQLNEINTDPTKLTGENYDPNSLLSQAQLKYANLGYYQLLYQSTMMQLLASTYNYYNNGDKYINVGSFTDYQGRIFDEGYKDASYIREMQRLARLKDPALNQNLIAIGDIMFVMILQRITDTYGDVPYTEAVKAMEGIKFPVYDRQEAIYSQMLNDLEKAIAQLDSNKPGPTADLFYKGDIDKWRRFGYSLMMRIAMRLTKVDPGKARVWAEKAAGKTFTTINDNAILVTDASSFDSQNGTSLALRTYSDYLEVRWSKTLIDQLRDTNDPRLGVIGEVPNDGLAKSADQNLPGNTDASVQLGLPNGYDLQGGATDIGKAPGYPGGKGSGSDFAPLGKYSRPRTAVYLKLGGPIFILSYAETEFLLAEAKVRGWNVGGSAKSHYANGLTSAIQSLVQLDPLAAVEVNTLSDFVNQNPLDESNAENALAAINTQYWITTGTTFNFIEAWLNWKRSDYPKLVPVNYKGNVTNGTIPRRMIYLSTEILNNPQNYKDAVSRIPGGDVLTSRVWWDR
ncbi:SusD/RagB family nutrient-binding outer membrane lipoprotein [Pedobacter petrophilus]|uniref:SusD/RagB family nutrient-binding outer membrane lipoprotein n=1 Tax=Pedobacter petrophilus TaxID=1908241 RepID=A0A7K0G3M0_9SPHI|nr:SusD/RagB family nutrient-binding outer membrane lipoprotein [Pedobacter petrophilus]MRX78403.1 SusD/RagB family nutrient-binding outer membrane lipoprotein [Pedobacter petrophilus]